MLKRDLEAWARLEQLVIDADTSQNSEASQIFQGHVSRFIINMIDLLRERE